MTEAEKIEKISTNLSNLVDEVWLVCTEAELKQRFGYSKKYLNEQKSKAKKAKKAVPNATVFRNLTTILEEKKFQKERDDERLGKLAISWVNKIEAENAANASNETRDPDGKYHPMSVIHARGTMFEYYERGETEENQKRKLFTEDLFKDSKRVMDITDPAMLPYYPPGSLVGMREITDKIIIPGDVYVVELDNSLLVRRLFYKDNDQETNMFKLVSYNTGKEEGSSPEGNMPYPSFDIAIAKVKKLFKVTWVLNRMP